MEAFTTNQWLVLALVFVLGLVIGMMLFASPKWKRRYRDEAERVRELENENARLRRESDEMHSLRRAAARDEARHDDRDREGPL